MANESNYTMVILRDDNITDKACPVCKNNEIDMLEIDDCDNIHCLNCGYIYSL